MARRSRLSSFNVLVGASNAAPRNGLEVPPPRRAVVRDLEYLRAILTDPAGRRFVLEFFVYGTLALLFVFLVFTPALTAAFPGAFPAGSDGFGRFDGPETTLEWTQAFAGTLLLAAYVYGRLLFTDLGDEVRALLDEEVLER
jgi:hypothetical protein